MRKEDALARRRAARKMGGVGADKTSTRRRASSPTRAKPAATKRSGGTRGQQEAAASNEWLSYLADIRAAYKREIKKYSIRVNEVAKLAAPFYQHNKDKLPRTGADFIAELKSIRRKSTRAGGASSGRSTQRRSTASRTASPSVEEGPTRKSGGRTSDRKTGGMRGRIIVGVGAYRAGQRSKGGDTEPRGHKRVSIRNRRIVTVDVKKKKSKKTVKVSTGSRSGRRAAIAIARAAGGSSGRGRSSSSAAKKSTATSRVSARLASTRE